MQNDIPAVIEIGNGTGGDITMIRARAEGETEFVDLGSLGSRFQRPFVLGFADSYTIEIEGLCDFGEGPVPYINYVFFNPATDTPEIDLVPENFCADVPIDVVKSEWLNEAY